MNFLDKNGFRAALVVAVIFLAMPFMFPERVPVNDKGNAADSSQPVKSKKFLTGVFDRVGSFYGFKKNKKSAIDQALDKLKQEADAASAEKKAEGAAATKDSFEKSASDSGSSSGESAGGSSFDMGSSSSKAGYTAAAAKAAKPKLSFGGKDYEVVKDLYGNDYAITDRGPITVNSLLAKGGVLKYPSGKTVSRTGVSAEAYNPGGGANPYSSLTASSKASGSYKGGKKGSSVASTRKISSGFSLSGGGGGIASKSSRRRGGASGFVNDVSLAEAYDNVQATATSVVNNHHAASLEDQTVYYDVASPVAARASVPASAEASAINPDFVYSETMFDENTKRASPAQVSTDASSQTQTASTQKTGLDLNQLPGEKEEDKADTKVPPKAEVKVKIDFSKGDSVIPGNGKIRGDMTKALLGDKVEFVSVKTDNGEPVPDPWLIPTKVSDGKFSYAFWQKNQAALSSGSGKFSDPDVWSEVDKNNIKTMKPSIKEEISKKGPITIIVRDGGQDAGKENYFQQQADFLTNKNSEVTGVKVYAVPDPRDVSSIIDSPYVFVYDRVITPGHNNDFAQHALTMIQSIKPNGNANQDKGNDNANKDKGSLAKVDSGTAQVSSKAITAFKTLEGDLANTKIIPSERPIK